MLHSVVARRSGRGRRRVKFFDGKLGHVSRKRAKYGTPKIPAMSDSDERDAFIRELQEGYRQNPVVDERDRTRIFALIREAAKEHQTSVCVDTVEPRDIVFHVHYPRDIRHAFLRVGSKPWVVTRWLKQIEGVDVKLTELAHHAPTSMIDRLMLMAMPGHTRQTYSTLTHSENAQGASGQSPYRLVVVWERLLAENAFIVLDTLPGVQSIDSV